MFGCHHQIPTASFKRVPSEQRGSFCERGTKDRLSERLFAGGGEFNYLSKLCPPPALTARLRLSRRLGEADAPTKAIRHQLAPPTRPPLDFTPVTVLVDLWSPARLAHSYRMLNEVVAVAYASLFFSLTCNVGNFMRC